MIPVDSLLYKIDQKLNKLSTNSHQQIPLEDKILALNEAQIKLIKQKVDGFSTPAGMGQDSFKKRYEDLQRLSVTYDQGKLPLVLADKTINRWSANLNALKPEYMMYEDSYVIAERGPCKDRKIWINKDLARHGDLQYLLNNEHYRPSSEYQETFNWISSDEISIFTDGTFIPLAIYIMYLRYPDYIDHVGYIKFDGTESKNVDCELEMYLEDELLDLTVQTLATYIENQSAIQSSQMRIQTNE